MPLFTLEHLHQLMASKNQKEADTTLFAFMESVDFPHFVYTQYAQNFQLPHETSNHVFVSEDLINWHHHFHANRYDKIDTVGKQVKQDHLPQVWSLNQVNKTATGLMKKMVTEALDHGLSAGISFAIGGPFESKGIMVIHGQAVVDRCKKDPTPLLALQQVAEMYHTKIGQLSNKNTQLPISLTQREIDCLTYSAKGNTAKQIAGLLNRSERTVIFHLENAKRKLGASNKQRAVLEALRLGVLTLA